MSMSQQALQREAREATKALRELESVNLAIDKNGKVTTVPPQINVGHPNIPEGLVTDADYAQFRPYKGGDDD